MTAVAFAKSYSLIKPPTEDVSTSSSLSFQEKKNEKRDSSEWEGKFLYAYSRLSIIDVDFLWEISNENFPIHSVSIY